MRGSSGIAFSARAGLMWPPVSLEHEGADWHVKDSITPSAINSWIGEEVRPVAAEGTLGASLGAHKLRATAAVIAANDTAGTLLTFRGWALHDRTTLAFSRQPLPPLGDDFAEYPGAFTHPLIDLHRGFAHRPGYYAKLTWQPPVPVRIELFRYDNRANPEDVNADLRMGLAHAVRRCRRWSRTSAPAPSSRRRRSRAAPAWAFRWTGAAGSTTASARPIVLLTQPFGQFGLAARADAFDTRNRGSLVDRRI